MKKIFSLVLALVMALSLTTVAFGATTGNWTHGSGYGEVVQVGDTYYLRGDSGNGGPFMKPTYTGEVMYGFAMSAKFDVSGVQAGETISLSFAVNDTSNVYLDEAVFTFGGIANGVNLYQISINTSNANNNIVLAQDIVATEVEFKVEFAPNAAGKLAATFFVNGNEVGELATGHDYTEVGGPRYVWMFHCTSVNGLGVVSDPSVVAIPPVAQVGTTKYATVAAAIAAAQDGDTIVLLDGSATIPAGYTVLQNSADTWVVVPVGTSTAGDYKIYANTVAGTLYRNIDVNQASIFTKVPATAPKMGDNGTTWVDGNIEYYVAKDLARNNLYFYEVADKDDATHVIKNGKTVYKYVVMMSDPSEAAYTYTATVSKNTAMNNSECGKVDISAWAKTDVLYTYTDSLGDVKFAKKDAAGAVSLLVDGVIVKATVQNVNTHTFFPTYTAGDVSGATCGKCGLVASRVKTAASLPEKFVVVNGVTCTGAFTGNILYYVPAAAPAAGTTTGTVVESAKTFDAGIAMYVGMSVMAAAGSAVVIGKKKD